MGGVDGCHEAWRPGWLLSRGDPSALFHRAFPLNARRGLIESFGTLKVWLPHQGSTRHRLCPAVAASNPFCTIASTTAGMRISLRKRSSCNNSSARSVGPGYLRRRRQRGADEEGEEKAGRRTGESVDSAAAGNTPGSADRRQTRVSLGTCVQPGIAGRAGCSDSAQTPVRSRSVSDRRRSWGRVREGPPLGCWCLLTNLLLKGEKAWVGVQRDSILILPP